MLQPNDLARTPFEPSGIVEVLAIEPAASVSRPTAFIRFAENHPAGYSKGSFGRYFLDELIPIRPSRAPILPA